MPNNSHEISVEVVEGDKPPTPTKPDLDPGVDFAAGTIAGIVGLSVGFPLDTVKVRFQGPETAHRYDGMSTFTAIIKIVKEERLRGLYKRITSPMAGCAFLNGLVFSSYGLFMRLQVQHDSDVPSIAQIGLAGAGSGVVASLITCPMELLKIQQQITITSQPSLKDVAFRIVKAHGMQGLFRGITATALRDCGYGAYFASYEAACRMLRSSPNTPYPHTSLVYEATSELENLSWPRLMLSGGIAGVMGWLATFGFDVVKTRIQATERLQGNPYHSTLSTIVHSYKTEGPKVFFIGIIPTLIRAFPVNMATFGAFELVVKAFS